MRRNTASPQRCSNYQMATFVPNKIVRCMAESRFFDANILSLFFARHLIKNKFLFPCHRHLPLSRPGTPAVLRVEAAAALGPSPLQVARRHRLAAPAPAYLRIAEAIPDNLGVACRRDVIRRAAHDAQPTADHPCHVEEAAHSGFARLRRGDRRRRCYDDFSQFIAPSQRWLVRRRVGRDALRDAAFSPDASQARTAIRRRLLRTSPALRRHSLPNRGEARRHRG